jgi:hypothetical protein
MVDAWNCQKHYVMADPQIDAENIIIIDLEIVNENWLTADVCNRQGRWIHDQRIKSIAKLESWLAHGIVKNAMSQLIHKSPAKQESL